MGRAALGHLRWCLCVARLWFWWYRMALVLLRQLHGMPAAAAAAQTCFLPSALVRCDRHGHAPDAKGLLPGLLMTGLGRVVHVTDHCAMPVLLTVTRACHA